MLCIGETMQLPRWCLVGFLFLAISGCSKSHSPESVAELHSQVADFRRNVLRPNVVRLLDELTSKIEAQWVATNRLIYEREVSRLEKSRDSRLSFLAVDDKNGALSIMNDYINDVKTLDSQFADAAAANANALKHYRQTILDKLNSQFDRSEQADIALIRYEIGLAPSTLDNFLVGNSSLKDH